MLAEQGAVHPDLHVPVLWPEHCSQERGNVMALGHGSCALCHDPFDDGGVESGPEHTCESPAVAHAHVQSGPPAAQHLLNRAWRVPGKPYLLRQHVARPRRYHSQRARAQVGAVEHFVEGPVPAKGQDDALALSEVAGRTHRISRADCLHDRDVQLTTQPLAHFAEVAKRPACSADRVHDQQHIAPISLADFALHVNCPFQRA